MNAIRSVLDRLTGAFCCVLLSVMIVVVVWQVVSRYVLNDPSTFSEELLRFGVIWLSLIGAAYVAGRNKHMSINILVEHATGRKRTALQILIQVFFLLFALGILLPGGIRAVGLTGQQFSPVLQIPMSYIYAAIPTSGVLIAIYSLLNIADVVRGAGDTPPSSMQEILASED
jgi:TRAP-type C4-dicarboxylate transport system permease small subunit